MMLKLNRDQSAVENIEDMNWLRFSAYPIFIFMMCFLFSFLDRVNMSYAALTMNAEIGLSPTAFGFGASLFYMSYIAFELPASWGLKIFGVKKWLGRIMISTGVVSASSALIYSESTYYLARLMLGVVEAGCVPAIIVGISYWIPKSARAQALSLCFVTAPIASLIGGPIASILLDLKFGTFSGWQILLLIEAIPSILLGLYVLFVFPAEPRQARWISPDLSERVSKFLLQERQATEKPELKSLGFWKTVTAPTVLALGLTYFGIFAPWTGINVWMPQVIKQLGFSNQETGIILVIPSLFSIAGMIFLGRVADKYGRAQFIIPAALLIVAASLLLSTQTSNPYIKICLYCAATFFTFGANPVLWSMSARIIAGPFYASGISAVSAIGAIAAFITPTLLGYIRDVTGSFQAPIQILSAIVFVFAIFALSQVRRFS